jgi:predicted ester cyclase
MAGELHKARLVELLRAVDAGELQRVLSFYHPQYHDHDASEARQGGNHVEALAAAFPRFYAAFTDVRHSLDDMIGEGDKVAARISVEARHTGELFGIAPTGKLVYNDSIVIYRFESGLIRERWCRERRSTHAAVALAADDLGGGARHGSPS